MTTKTKGTRCDLRGYTVFVDEEGESVLVVRRDSGHSSYGVRRGARYEWDSCPSICNRLLREAGVLV